MYYLWIREEQTELVQQMTGIWTVEVKGKKLVTVDGDEKHFEGIELPDIVWNNIGKLVEGETITIECVLRE